MARRLSILTTLWVVLFALLSTGTALAQDDTADEDEAAAEPQRYGDSELIETLRSYGLLDEWIAASPVSPEASLLLVRGGSYQAQRQTFLNSLETWARRTERVREDVNRVETAQANADLLRSTASQVREALVFDDRLTSDSDTLVTIDSALAQLAGVQIPEQVSGDTQDPMTLAEIQLSDLRVLAESELVELNSRESALKVTGVESFLGYDSLVSGLNDVDQLISRGRSSVRPAREESERLAASALAQIPNLHAARMTGSTDVAGMSVVTVDAYIRAAQRVSCSVDWALLAGIGRIESNHGRLGGASVSRSGQVSTTILGPLLDGGQTEQDIEVDRGDAPDRGDRDLDSAEIELPAAQAAFGISLWNLLRADADELAQESSAEGNGFAIVADTDGGRLDGNDQWDRAVGPMQFLPETWSRWATDGNGDGVSDPNNLYDSAAAAARFVCDLSARRGSSPSSFILGYNASTSYVRSVISTAQSLRATSLPEAR